MIRRKVPRDEESFDLMLQNMDGKCPNYKTALNISDAQLDVLKTDAAAYHDWRLVKNQIAESKVSITNFVKILFTGDKKDPLPTTPVVNIGSPALPAKPGIETRTKEFIEYLELQDNFTDAIGLDLGFYEDTSGAVDSENLIGDFKVKDLAGYKLEVAFGKKGQDALDLSWRVKGSAGWNKIRLTSSPYTLEIPPDANGLAVTIEMQGILIKKNEPVGQSSDLKTAIAHA
jgi:hypothetical protein